MLHKNGTVDLLGGFPISLEEALVFVEFEEYITFLEDIQVKKHIIIDFLPIGFNNKGTKTNKCLCLEKCKV